MSEPEKLGGDSLDVAAEKRAELRQLFPAAFTESENENGELVESVDFERLKAELGQFTELFERRRERYGMEWPGKTDCLKVIQEPSRATLKPCREESVDFDATGNLFIEGDNLEALKLLQKSYHGQVKMIYIDPPYNTGNEFIYPDKFAESLDTYLEYAGLTDDKGRRIESRKNSRDEGRFHTKWLNMMYPRLYLARNLLRDDGVIFISIDDNEVTNLRKLCDEVFGDENFIEQIAWKNKYGSGALTKGFANVHEYVFAYSKIPIKNIAAPLSDEQKAAYKNKDEKFSVRGGYITQPLATTSKDDRPNLIYPIYHKGIKILPEKQWIWAEERTKKAQANNELVINEKNGKFSVRMKQYLRDENGVERLGKPISLLNGPFNQAGTKEVKELFEGKAVFDFPKPSDLMRYFFACVVNDEQDNEGIYLDFFAGSSVSAQAVMKLNKEDGGNRRFIMVQLPEPCDEKSEAAKAGYRTIADIGKERIRRVIKKIETEEAEKAKATEDELKLGDKEKPAKQDLGFRVLKLDKSNFKAWQPLTADASEEQIKEALQAHLFHVDEGSTQEDILFEILLKAGFMPSTRIEALSLAGGTVYSVGDGALFICLEDDITRELIDAVVKEHPQQFICLDRGFKGNDQLKANTVQTFNALNESKENSAKIIFRTV